MALPTTAATALQARVGKAHAPGCPTIPRRRATQAGLCRVGVVSVPATVKESLTAQLPAIWQGRNASRIATLALDLRPRAVALIQAALEAGVRVVVTEGRRTPEKQAKLYAQGRTTPGRIVTWTLKSKHLDGLAFDVGVLDDDGVLTWPDDDDLWERIGKLGEARGLRWGGRWTRSKDRPHFEL